MKAEEVFSNTEGKKGELSHKLRTVSDLIRHIKTKEHDSPANYSIFLGAGASVTSGIRTASQLIDEWAKELYERFNDGETVESAEMARKFFESRHSSWYSPDNPYSSLFEKKFDLPTQRRRFVEQEVDSKFPSIGYAYLTSLVDKNYFNTIFTTNFDDLVNEAFYLFSNARPIVCAHDSSIHSISITSKRPKVVKLHGDYLFDDIKSTLRETESLEQNTKEKFVEFCKEYGLIIVGYSGSDRSIMDVLEFLARQENYLKNGIYWCLRRTDNVCHALKNLIWKDKVYPVLIDGFDELFAEIHAQTVVGELKLNSNKKQSKLYQTVQNIVNDSFGLSKNTIIEQEILSIKDDGDSKDISEFVKQMSVANESSKLGMRDVRNLLEIDTLIESFDLQKAEEICSMYYEATTNPEDRKVYIEKYIDIYERLGLDYKVSLWCDKLIETDPNNIQYHLKKARSIEHLADRVEYLTGILESFTYSTALLNTTASALIRRIREEGADSVKKHSEALSTYLDRSLAIDPSLDNSAWSFRMEFLRLTHFIINDPKKKKEIAGTIAEHVKLARTRNPEHPQTLELAEQQLDIACEKDDLQKLINFLFELAKKSSTSNQKKVNAVIAKSFGHVYEIEDNETLKIELKRFIEEYLDAKDKGFSVSYARIRYWLSIGKDLEIANQDFKTLLGKKHLGSQIGAILKLPMEFDQTTLDILEKKLESEKHVLLNSYYFETLSEIYILKSDYSTAEQHLEAAYREGIPLTSYIASKTYILLLAEKYSQVLTLATRYETQLASADTETIQINIQFAAKKCGSRTYSEVTLRNLSALSSSYEVKICAFSLLGQYNDAKRIIKKKLEMDPGLIFKYNKWPALDKECYLNETCQENTATG
ncbi:SIR2 family protein [Pseudomonas syringae group sp. 243L2]|uniref:SIR2 family protein n=1 Tax=Pseudomonas syringae group sp. 243L2 TaxID=3079593 RepID=UPI002909179D|nr:SIR2 family protein [Pseudomonas syringae group sp. 243L2]MDU8629757.1 SIR2 family protein [Pseudomonas syringae group sp. 243L2]